MARDFGWNYISQLIKRNLTWTGNQTFRGSVNLYGPAGVTLSNSTAPGSSPADAVQLWSADHGTVAGNATLHVRDEAGRSGAVAFANPPEITAASGVTLTIPQVSNTFVGNYGQAGANVTIGLPVAAAGYSFVAVVSTSQTTNSWKFKTDTSDRIYLDGVVGTDNWCSGVSPTVGNFITFFTFKSGSTTYEWMAQTGAGSWKAVA